MRNAFASKMSAMFFLVFARRQEKSRRNASGWARLGKRPERWNGARARRQTLSRALNRPRAFRGVPVTPRRLHRRSSFSRTFLSRLSSFFAKFARRPQVLLAVSTWVERCARTSSPRRRARSRATRGGSPSSPHPPGTRARPLTRRPLGLSNHKTRNRPVGRNAPITNPETRRCFRFVTFPVCLTHHRSFV